MQGSQKWPFSVILGPVGLPGGNGYGIYRRKTEQPGQRDDHPAVPGTTGAAQTDRPKPPACTGAAGRPEKTPFRQVIGET